MEGGEAGALAGAPAGGRAAVERQRQVAVQPGAQPTSEVVDAEGRRVVQAASSSDAAIRILLDKTDGNGDPSGINGPENLQARTEIVSALTGRPVADLAADPRHKFITSVLQVEKLLHEAVGIKDADLRDRRAAFVEWLDAREGVAQPQGLQVDDTLDAEEDAESSADLVVRQAEVEVDPHEFVATPDGSTDFGEITPEMAQAMRRQAGKIRLQRGDDSFGEKHIELRHGDDIRRLGFQNVAGFVADIARNISQVWQPGKTSQLVAIHELANDRVMFVELRAARDDSGDYYTVRSAFPARKGFVKNKGWDLLWEDGRAQPSTNASSSAPFAEPTPSDAGESATIPSGQSSDASVAPAEQNAKAPEIADFGEKLGGARKDVWQAYGDRLKEAGELDVAAEPLAKSWPAPDYDALLAAGADPWTVAFVHASRDAIPAKPRMGYKVRAWADTVTALRETASGMLDGSLSQEAARRALDIMGDRNRAARGIAGRVDLYLAVGHGKSLHGVTLEEHYYSLYKGEENVRKWVVEQQAKATSFSNWPRELAVGDNKAQAIEAFKARMEALLAESPAAKSVSFEIFSKRGEAGYHVGKKIGRNPTLLAGPFATLKEAREHMAAHNADLVERLEKFKEIPAERRSTNEPRLGEDVRGGQDATPELFAETFGFRGVEFGNWVEQARRQKDLNDAFDALMDMAAVLGVPPKALSLNGELGLAFGARGKGGKGAAAAHYEPGYVAINLTKKEGAGSLGHEWWHALDNYFSRMRGDKAGFVSEFPRVKIPGDDRVRQEMLDAFGAVMRAINLTRLRARSAKLDARRTKAYWTTGPEMSARAFESFLISKLQDQGASNDYLANIVDEETWKAAEALGFELDGSYPYPTAGEVPAVRAAFDEFFSTIQTRETDRGVALFRLGEGVDLGPMDFGAVSAAVGRIVAANKKNWDVGIDTVPTFDALPDDVKKAVAKYGKNKKPKGVLHQGRVYVVADRHTSEADVEATILHEVEGHVGIHRLYGKDINTRLNQLYLAIGGRKGLSEIARKRGITSLGAYAEALGKSEFTDDVRVQIMMDEVLAHVAESRKFGDRVKAIVGAIRQWLRDHGFAELAEYGETDLLHILAQGRKQLKAVKADAGQTVLLFAGQPIGAEARPGITESGLRSAFKRSMPGLSVALDSMLERGRAGEKGGVVLIESADPGEIARVFAVKTGQQIEDAAASIRESSAMRLWVGARSINDFLVPETQEYDGNTTGDLALVDGASGIPDGPVRVTVGVATGSHKGHGMLHMADNAKRDARRAPAAETQDLAENLMREAVVVLKGVKSIHHDGGAYLMVNPGLNMAVVATFMNGYYSVTSVRPYRGDPVSLWGRPEWNGRLAFPSRESAADSPSEQIIKAGASPRLDRSGQEVKSERFDLTNPMPIQQGRQAREVVVTVKKRRKIEPRFSRNGMLQGFNDERSGLTFLIGPNLSERTAPGVLMHEVVHGQQREKLDAAAQQLIAGRDSAAPALRAFLDRVQERIDNAGAQDDPREAMPYIVEQAVIEGQQHGFSAADSKFLDWVDQRLGKPVGNLIRALVMRVRAWAYRNGLPLKTLYVDDLVTISRAMMRETADGNIVLGDGEVRHSFAGRDAETADRHALTSAQRRIAQGEDAEAVRQDTGWHRGADGMWRFEISDDQAQLKVGGNTAAEILDAAALDADTVRVGDVLDHPQLFAAYPHLEHIRVELMPAGEPAIARLMRDATGARMQVRGSVKRAALPSVMLHELQHAIQGAEGFAEGGSRGALTSDLDKSGAETYRRLAGEVEARNTQSRQRMTAQQRRAVSPDATADVLTSDVIVTFNGQPMTGAPSNAVATAPMTERGLVRALRLQFPGLVAPVESMLERGRDGRRGGLVMIDSADPLRIAGAFSKLTGRALDDSIELFSGGGKPKGFYDARSGLTFVFGPNVDAVTAPAVLLHEMVHGQQKQRIDRLARDMLMNRGTEPDADLRAFLDRVVERIVDADAVGDVREFAAYIVEQAVTEGRSRGYTMVDGRFFAWADSTLGKKMGDFLRSVAAMVRSWMIRHGGIKALTVDDLVGYAMAGVERAARGSVAGGKHVSASLSDPEVRALVEQYAGVDGAPSEAQLRDAVRQFRETERAYGGREGYDRAKSAGKTKLNYRQWVQVRTPNFKAWFGDWESAALRAFLDGPPLQKLKTSDAPHQGFAKLRDWAVGIFADYGNYATNETLGRVLMDERAVRDSMGHRMSPFKAIAFKAVPDVIERGKVVHSERSGNVDSFWISAPVEIDGTADIVTVMVHRDPATQRMYLHSVATKEYLLNHKQSGAPNKSASSPGAVRAGGIEKILHGALNFNGEVSKVTDPETAEPLMMFHGSRNGDITKFAPSTYFTEDASEAGDYATGHAVYPAYINIRRPYEASDDVDEENRSELTEIDEDYAEQLSTEGHDGVVARRNGETLWAIPFSQEHVKSAAGNVGTFDGASADIRFSRSGLATAEQHRRPAVPKPRAADAFGDLSTDQRTFLDKVGTPPTRVRVSEWVKARADRIGTKIRQGLVDRYASLKELDEKLHGKDFIDTAITDSSWVMARMASSAAGAMSAMMNTGRIRFDAKQRVIAMQDGDQSGGLVAVLSQIGDPAEVERFMAWIAANRADKLMKEGREHLFTPDEIDAGKTLNVGRTTDGRGRAMVYAKAFREFQQYRDDVLAVAEATGAISAENRAMWKDEFYVPFYRVMDEEATKGAPRGSKGLSRQEAYKRLKGGSQNLNDLLENTLMNFHHLLTSGLKNQAAAQTIHNAKALGIARKVSDSERDPKTSTFVLEDGKRVFYEIDDPLVYEALTTLSDPGLNSTAVRVMSSFKRLFTNMTTVTPQFIVANLMRDLMQATATSPVSKNVFKNLGQGLKGYADEKTRAQMMASGGAFSFGHLYGADVDEVKASLARQMKGSQLISDPSMIPKAIKAGWNAWGKVTDSAENVSRAAVFQQNMDKGALRAAFEARDLMDFSSHGAWPAVRFLIRVVPFLNARLQGLDKIYRAGVKPSLLVAMGKGSASDRQAAARFAVVTGALTLATIALYLANADDDDYRELEDWQKDTYWVFKLGGSMYFLPKPFEVGAIATMAERITEQFMDDKATGKLFRDRMSDMFMQTFAFNPVPQLFQPMLDIYSNKDAFTKRDIESMSMERLSKGLRARDTTTAAAHAVSSATRALGDDSPVALSPIQADHLIRGYFGAVGANVAALIDTAWRAANGETEPDKRWSEYQPIRRFYKDLGAPEPYTRYSTLFYEGLREAARVHADVRELRSLGRMDEASALMADKRNVLAMRLTLERQQRRISEINKQLVSVRRSDRDGAWKRREIDRLNTIKGAITEQWGKLIEKARAAG